MVPSLAAGQAQMRSLSFPAQLLGWGLAAVPVIACKQFAAETIWGLVQGNKVTATIDVRNFAAPVALLPCDQ